MSYAPPPPLPGVHHGTAFTGVSENFQMALAVLTVVLVMAALSLWAAHRLGDEDEEEADDG